MFQVLVKATFRILFIYLHVKLFVKLAHETYVIHWIAYVRAVDLDQELVPFAIANPLQQTLIPLAFYFLGVDRVNLRAVRRHCVLMLLMYVIRHHHLVEVHVF